jgi:dynactin 1
VRCICDEKHHGTKVYLVTGIEPWITRIEEIQAQMSLNVEADHKAAQLTEEIQNLARGIKTRVSTDVSHLYLHLTRFIYQDQAIQESTVKIELMERRLDSAKKQVDAISELENEVSRLRKEEKRLLQDQQQAAILTEQLENENAKLKIAGASGHDRRSEYDSAHVPL